MEAVDARREEESRANAGPSLLEDAPTALPLSDPWDTVVHFGKVIRGKTLRELTSEQREWLFDTWLRDFDAGTRQHSQLDHDLADAIRKAAPLAKDQPAVAAAEQAKPEDESQDRGTKPEDESQAVVTDIQKLRGKLAEDHIDEALFVAFLRLPDRKVLSSIVLSEEQGLKDLKEVDFPKIVMKWAVLRKEFVDTKREHEKARLLANTMPN